MSQAAISITVTQFVERKRQPLGVRLARLPRQNPIGTIGAVVIIFVILVAIFAPLISPYNPTSQAAKRLLEPSAEHLMGTDELGRDVFSRIIFGSRISLQVGIIAVDPTSPYTGGAILGDRIRMQRHADDEGIFIRSMATRGFLGGLARTTGEVQLVLDAAGKQFILVETVGVGQDEVDIVRLADCTLVLLVPGLGDDVQSMKAGLMEIADIFVLNKFDREGADRLEADLQAMLHLAPQREGWKPRIVRSVATANKGVEELAEAIKEYREHANRHASIPGKKIAYWKRRLAALAEDLFLRNAISDPAGELLLDQLAREVAGRKTDPYAAARALLAHADGNRKSK